MEKVNNLLNFSDFEKGWNPKEAKKTKRTETGLDVLEKRKLAEDLEIDDDELIEDDDDMEIGGEIRPDLEDGDVDELEDADDSVEDSDWQEELTALIDSIIEGGEEPEEIIAFIEDYLSEEGGEYEGEDLDEDDLDEDDDEDDLEDADDDLEETDEVADDEEGEGVQERKRWRR